MRLIDVEQVYCAECEHKDNCKYLVDQQIIFCDVPSMPTIDAVPVVRCKDCVYYIPAEDLPCEYDNPIDADGLCDNIDKYADRDGFCSQGKRREENASG